MNKFLKGSFFFFLFFVIFVVLTFPFGRLAPKARRLLESNLGAILGIQVSCTLDDFSLALPFGFYWSKLTCLDDSQNQKVIDLGESSLTLLPKRQVLTAVVGQGTLRLQGNAGLKSPPSRIEGEFKDVPVDKLLPMILGSVKRVNPFIPRYLKADGKLQGKLDWPLKNLQKEKGKIDLQFSNLKFPQQEQLDQIGVKDLAFSKSLLKVDLASGKMSFQDVNFLAPQLSGKVEGSLDVAEDFQRSIGNIALKWKIEKSDALLSSPFGPLIANNCPNPDSEGYCTRRIQRVSDLQ